MQGEAVRSGHGVRDPALDGIRGVAVIAVVLYHVAPDTFHGGYLGVDVFFALSGYLITSLLLNERTCTGSIDLRRFWARRMRRLWPLAWLVLGVVALVSLAGAWGADRQRSLPWQVVAAVGQFSNWYQVAHEGYLTKGIEPSPLRHFWSLAIEEQYYVVWPPLLLALTAAGRRWRAAVPVAIGALIAGTVVAGALASGADRAYLGTDVRVVGPLAGAGLAWAFRHRPLAGPTGEPSRRGSAATVVGLVGLGGLGLLWALAPASSPFMGDGGFALAALSSTMVVAATVTSTPFRVAAGWAPLAWLGRISYALYLVHWPMLAALGPTVPMAVRVLVAFPVAIAAAAILHEVVERPVIRGAVAPRWLAAGGLALVTVAALALGLSVPEGATPAEQVAQDLDPVADPTTAAPTTAAPTGSTVPGSPTTAPTTTAPCPTTTAAGSLDTGDTDAFDPETVDPLNDPAAPGCGDTVSVLIVGDSTGRGAANGLARVADPRLQIWDRTTLGCSLGDEDCPDWRRTWAEAVQQIDPDVVLMYTGIVSDFHDVDDPPFLSERARLVRAGQLHDAFELLGAGGAAVLAVREAPPRPPKGIFFCQGKARDSNCDPRWFARWNEDLAAVAAVDEVTVVDVAGWLESRGNTSTDRPDGLHLAGPALVDHAEWLVPQLVASAG